MIHETRVVPLDGRAHVGPKLRTYMGDSRGHWEGDTLVIETTNFNGKVGLTRNGNTTPVTADLKLTERLTRIDARTMRYEATVSDPRTWSRPWTVSLPFTLHPEYGMFEYACHEGNYAMKAHPQSRPRGRVVASADPINRILVQFDGTSG
jgi:hypothetical protein